LLSQLYDDALRLSSSFKGGTVFRKFVAYPMQLLSLPVLQDAPAIQVMLLTSFQVFFGLAISF